MQVLPNLLNVFLPVSFVECLPSGIIKWAKRLLVGPMIFLAMKKLRDLDYVDMIKNYKKYRYDG